MLEGSLYTTFCPVFRVGEDGFRVGRMVLELPSGLWVYNKRVQFTEFLVGPSHGTLLDVTQNTQAGNGGVFGEKNTSEL